MSTIHCTRSSSPAWGRQISHLGLLFISDTCNYINIYPFHPQNLFVFRGQELCNTHSPVTMLCWLKLQPLIFFRNFCQNSRSLFVWPNWVGFWRLILLDVEKGELLENLLKNWPLMNGMLINKWCKMCGNAKSCLPILLSSVPTCHLLWHLLFFLQAAGSLLLPSLEGFTSLLHHLHSCLLSSSSSQHC